MQLSLFDLFTRNKPSAQEKTEMRPVARSASSDPDLLAIWQDLRRRWFPEREDLEYYTVRWSNRPQKRTLACCNVYAKRVTVARELRYPALSCWLSPLLYHEMCHAYLGELIDKRTNRRRWHGPEFRQLERRNPAICDLDRWIKQGGWAEAVRSDRAWSRFVKSSQ